jgi:hypothetical protein
MNRLWLLALAILGSCTSGLPGPRETAPLAPGKNDDSFAVNARHWTLIETGASPGDRTLAVDVAAPADVEYVDAWIGGDFAGRLARGAQDDNRFVGELAIAALPAGSHELVLAADGSEVGFAQHEFIRSAPMYVVVSTDWDDADNDDATLRRQEELRQRHPQLKLTHFVGPYTFTEGLAADRVDYLVSWVKHQRDAFGDEIGLHIHPYCSFVEEAGVSCRTRPSFAYSSGDSSGYTVILDSYTEDEMSALLQEADALFVAAGLGKPTSFRAGGWSAGLGTLRALADNGYVADTSAVNWRRLEEWEDNWGATLYSWNRDHWTAIDERSQPYHPSPTDQDVAADRGGIAILEVPDNGALVDYVSAEEMAAMFDASWEGLALAAPRAYSIGYHPPNFSQHFLSRMDGALTHIDEFLHTDDGGPVVYATLSDMAKVWPPAP